MTTVSCRLPVASIFPQRTGEIRQRCDGICKDLVLRCQRGCHGDRRRARQRQHARAPSSVVDNCVHCNAEQAGQAPQHHGATGHACVHGGAGQQHFEKVNLAAAFTNKLWHSFHIIFFFSSYQMVHQSRSIQFFSRRRRSLACNARSNSASSTAHHCDS